MGSAQGGRPTERPHPVYMEGVEVVVAVAGGVIVVAVIVVLAGRRRPKDGHSVASYRQTLDVLGSLGGAQRSLRPVAGGVERVAERSEGAVDPSAGVGIRRVSSRATFDGMRAPGELSPLAAGQRERIAPSRTGLGEAPGAEDAVRADTQSPSGPPAIDRKDRTDRALVSLGRPARRLGTPVFIAVLVLAAAGMAAYFVVRSHPASHAAATPAGHRHRARRGSHSTTTTVPSAYSAVQSTASSATYALAKSTYSLRIGATTSACWMSITSNGATVLAQTFAPGASAAVPVTGKSTLVIGAPASATVTISGIPLVLPPGASGPFTVTLLPS